MNMYCVLKYKATSGFLLLASRSLLADARQAADDLHDAHIASCGPSGVAYVVAKAGHVDAIVASSLKPMDRRVLHQAGSC